MKEIHCSQKETYYTTHNSFPCPFWEILFVDANWANYVWVVVNVMVMPWFTAEVMESRWHWWWWWWWRGWRQDRHELLSENPLTKYKHSCLMVIRSCCPRWTIIKWLRKQCRTQQWTQHWRRVIGLLRFNPFTLVKHEKHFSRLRCLIMGSAH